MRLDKFLKLTQLIKRRSVAKESAEEGVVKINGKPAKPASTVNEGDIIEIDMWNSYKSVKILQIPKSNSVTKASIPEYVETLEYRSK